MKLARRVPPILLAFAAGSALAVPAPRVWAQSRGGTGARVAANARADAVATARVAPASAAATKPAAPDAAGVRPVTPSAPAQPPAGAAPQPTGTPPAAAPPSAPSASPLNPSPSEMPPPASTTPVPDIEALMTRVTALRSRIAALGATLFSSKLRIELVAPSESARVKRLQVSLDGGVVYGAPAQAAFEQPQLVYEHAVAAGPHVIAIEIERQDERQPEYSTWQTSRFVVVVPERQLLWTRLKLEGESTMGEGFAEERSGRYELSVRLEAEAGE